MVRLHMLDHQIIRLSSCQGLLHIVQPFMGELSIHRIHNGNFFIFYHIGIVGHSIWDLILSLKQIQLMVVDACINDIVGNIHRSHSPFLIESIVCPCAFRAAAYNVNFTTIPPDFQDWRDHVSSLIQNIPNRLWFLCNTSMFSI